MLSLDDPRWGTYVGGYQVVYDASKVLRRLLKDEASDQELDEFGNELCHQGDLV